MTIDPIVEQDIAKKTNCDTALIQIGSQFQYFNKIESLKLRMPYVILSKHYWKIIVPLLTIIAVNSTKLQYLNIDCGQVYKEHKERNPMLN